jgi:hypothetical protein
MRPRHPGGATESTRELTEERSRKLAEAYRILVLCFGGQLVLTVLNIGGNLIRSGPVREMLGALVALGLLGSSAALAYFAYRTAEAMGSRAPWLWAVGIFVPCLNVVTLLALSSKATQMCRNAGIPVGFLGPKAPAGRP